MIRPSSGVMPMLVSILRPYSMAQALAPLPRCSVIIRNAEPGTPRCAAAAAAT